MLCTYCSKTFGVNAVKEQRGKGLKAQIKCPHCGAWLGKNPTLTRLKMISFYLGFAALIYGYFVADMRSVTTPVAIACLIVLMISHLMDHLKVVEAPEIVHKDDSADRQKYR